ncbi:MAG TPA: glycosyltransferase family 4 protein [Solirubrobacterales bacterium]|jgi:glycosyltransferase involved in cell wall biosynthesis
MRIGIVTKWFASGQAVVSRQIRSALDELGHETFVLAREGTGPRSGVTDRPHDPIWDQPGVTQTGESEVPHATFERWVDEHGLEVVMTDNLYQFDELRRLRERGVRTVGRFVWEHFAAEHAAGAKEAFDVVYSLHRAEQARYAEFGIDSPYVTWGCHPELVAVEPAARSDDAVTLLLPGSFMGRRKPLAEVLEAFARTRNPRLRLIVKGQTAKRQGKLEKAAAADSRIQIRIADEPTADHLRFVASCDVCLAPTRWEGLGLPLYEAIAFGQPVITNDNPPMNEAIIDGVNGLLVGATQEGTARSGIPSWSPNVDELADAIERIADDELRAELATGARELRDGERSWARTVEGLRDLLEAVS